jgi:hypothetical protein
MVVLGGAIVSVLVTGPRVRRGSSNTAEGDGFSGVIKTRSTPSFAREVEPSAPCREIVRYVQFPSKYEQIYFVRLNLSFHSPVLPALLLDDSAGRTARELWWTNE